MSYIEIEYNNLSGWFCDNDLILLCHRDLLNDNKNSPFMNDEAVHNLSSSSYINRIRHRSRHVPKVDFNDKNLFPYESNKIRNVNFNNRVLNERFIDKELVSELDSMLACREYVSKQNHFFDRKLFQQAQAAQADEEKKLEEFHKRQQEQIRIERQKRRRQHPSYVSRFDENRYVSSLRKKFYQIKD